MARSDITGSMLIKAKLPQVVEIDRITQIEIAINTIRYIFNLPDGCYAADGNIVYDEHVGGHNNDIETKILRKGVTVEEQAALVTIKQLKKVMVL